MRALAEEQDPDAAAYIRHDNPTIDPAWEWCWRAWVRLDHERPWRPSGFAAMGTALIQAVPGRIPWTAVFAWCAAHDYGPERRVFLDRVLMDMDTTFLELWRAEQDKG